MLETIVYDQPRGMRDRVVQLVWALVHSEASLGEPGLGPGIAMAPRPPEWESAAQNDID